MLTTYPDKILYTVSEDVTHKEGLKIIELLREEIRNLTWGNCVGLAAPQIGINKNVFIARDIAYINPKITWTSTDWQTFNEGCYSLPRDKFYTITRPKSIRMEWMNKKGEHCQATFNGFTAEVLQHEYDHLQGKLCCRENTPDQDETKV